jgi:hypothetical protein
MECQSSTTNTLVPTIFPITNKRQRSTCAHQIGSNTDQYRRVFFQSMLNTFRYRDHTHFLFHFFIIVEVNVLDNTCDHDLEASFLRYSGQLLLTMSWMHDQIHKWHRQRRNLYSTAKKDFFFLIILLGADTILWNIEWIERNVYSLVLAKNTQHSLL